MSFLDRGVGVGACWDGHHDDHCLTSRFSRKVSGAPDVKTPSGRRRNVPQRQRNTPFIFVGQTAHQAIQRQRRLPPGRRNPTDVRCAPTESASHLPGRVTSCAREPLAPHGPRRLPLSRRGPSPFLGANGSTRPVSSASHAGIAPRHRSVPAAPQPARPAGPRQDARRGCTR